MTSNSINRREFLKKVGSTAAIGLLSGMASMGAEKRVYGLSSEVKGAWPMFRGLEVGTGFERDKMQAYLSQIASSGGNTVYINTPLISGKEGVPVGRIGYRVDEVGETEFTREFIDLAKQKGFDVGLHVIAETGSNPNPGNTEHYKNDLETQIRKWAGIAKEHAITLFSPTSELNGLLSISELNEFHAQVLPESKQAFPSGSIVPKIGIGANDSGIRLPSADYLGVDLYPQNNGTVQGYGDGISRDLDTATRIVQENGLSGIIVTEVGVPLNGDLSNPARDPRFLSTNSNVTEEIQAAAMSEYFERSGGRVKGSILTEWDPARSGPWSVWNRKVEESVKKAWGGGVASGPTDYAPRHVQTMGHVSRHDIKGNVEFRPSFLVFGADVSGTGDIADVTLIDPFGDEHPSDRLVKTKSDTLYDRTSWRFHTPDDRPGFSSSYIQLGKDWRAKFTDKSGKSTEEVMLPREYLQLNDPDLKGLNSGRQIKNIPYQGPDTKIELELPTQDGAWTDDQFNDVEWNFAILDTNQNKLWSLDKTGRDFDSITLGEGTFHGDQNLRGNYTWEMWYSEESPRETRLEDGKKLSLSRDTRIQRNINFR